MVRAKAIVDVISPPPPSGKGLGKYRVECFGVEPYDFVRIYVIMARSEDFAARDGLDKFVAEIEPLIQEK